MQEVVGDGGILVERAGLAHGFARMLAEGEDRRPAARRTAERFRIDVARDAYLALYANALDRA
jgi:hypothetical protein